MRTKTTLFLLVLLAALSVVAFYLMPGIPPDKPRSTILGPDEAAQLDYLKFEFRDRPQAVVLEKQDPGWRIVEPVLWPASIFAVDRLLNQLQFLKKVSSFPAERLADYGLEPPEGVLTYGVGATQRRLRIGKLTDLEHNVYLLPDGSDQIVVAKRDLLTELRRPLEELRSNAVFSVPIFEVRSWIVHVGSVRVHLVREGEKWKLESPIKARADKDAVDTLLERVLSLRVESFSDDAHPDLNVLGLATPSIRITIAGSGGRDELLIGNAVDPARQPDVYYAKREDNNTVFAVHVADRSVPGAAPRPGGAQPPPLIETLRNAQVELRDRRVVEIDPERVQSITLEPAGQLPTTLQRLETGAWQVISRNTERGGLVTMDGDPRVIGALVEEIAELRAVRDGGFVIGGDAPSATDLDVKFGLTGPAWKIQLTERAPGAGTEIKPPQTIRLGRRVSANDQPGSPENLQYAIEDLEGFVYLVDRALSDELRPEPYHYRNRLLRQLAAGESITAFTLKRLANDEVIFTSALAGSDQSWADALIMQPAPRREAALALLKELRNLRARAIVAPEFRKGLPGTEAPWTWTLEVTIAQEGGATPQVTQMNLYFDAYLGGTDLLMGVPELNLVVSAEPGLIDALRPFLLERTDPGVPPAEAPPAATATPGTPGG